MKKYTVFLSRVGSAAVIEADRFEMQINFTFFYKDGEIVAQFPTSDVAGVVLEAE